MSTFVNFLIILLGAANIAALVLLTLAILKIVKGPVAWGKKRFLALKERGLTLVQIGKSTFLVNKEQVMALVADFAGLRDSLHKADFRQNFATEPVNLAKITGALATFQQVRSGWGLLSALRHGGLKAAIAHAYPKKTGTPHRSLADRMGFVPPLAKRLMPLVRVGRTALGVHRQLRSRGLL